MLSKGTQQQTNALHWPLFMPEQKSTRQGTKGIQKFPTSQQQIPLSKQRHWSLPAEGFSGLQIVQSLQWNSYTEPPSDIIYSHLLLLCSPGFTEEVFREAGQDQAQEAYRKCY